MADDQIKVESLFLCFSVSPSLSSLSLLSLLSLFSFLFSLSSLSLFSLSFSFLFLFGGKKGTESTDDEGFGEVLVGHKPREGDIHQRDFSTERQTCSTSEALVHQHQPKV